MDDDPLSKDKLAPSLEVNRQKVSSSLIAEVCGHLLDGKQVRQRLPGGGDLHIDRLLPFLCVCRSDPARRDPGTARLVESEASYLVAPGSAPFRRGLRRLVRQVAQTALSRLGSFLILEVWSGWGSSPSTWSGA